MSEDLVHSLTCDYPGDLTLGHEPAPAPIDASMGATVHVVDGGLFVLSDELL